MDTTGHIYLRFRRMKGKCLLLCLCMWIAACAPEAKSPAEPECIQVHDDKRFFPHANIRDFHGSKPLVSYLDTCGESIANFDSSKVYTWYPYYSNVFDNCRPCYLHFEDSMVYQYDYAGRYPFLNYRKQPPSENIPPRPMDSPFELTYFADIQHRWVFRDGLGFYEVSPDSGFMAGYYLNLNLCMEWEFIHRRGKPFIHDPEQLLPRIEVGEPYSVRFLFMNGYTLEHAWVSPDRDSIYVQSELCHRYTYDVCSLLGSQSIPEYCFVIQDSSFGLRTSDTLIVFHHTPVDRYDQPCDRAIMHQLNALLPPWAGFRAQK